MKKIFSVLVLSLLPFWVMATNYQYYVGVTGVTVENLSSGSSYKYKVTIEQQARNINMGNASSYVYTTTAELYLMPDQGKLEGTYRSNDNVHTLGHNSGAQSCIKSGSNTRYLNTDKVSTITIAKADQHHYYIVKGDIYVKLGSDTYEYHYSYDEGELTNAPAQISKKPFLFETTFSTGNLYNYNMYSISNLSQTSKQIKLDCKGNRVENSDKNLRYTITLNFPSSEIEGEYSNISVVDSKKLICTGSEVVWHGSSDTRRSLQDYDYSHIRIVKDGEGDLHIVDGILQVPYSETSVTNCFYHFDDTIRFSDTKAYNEVLTQSCGKLTAPLNHIQILRSMSKDYFNTFCSPVAMNTSLVESVFGIGADIRALENSSYDAESNEFNLTFSATSLTSIEAGKPYLVKPSYDMVDPILTYVAPSAFATEAQTVNAGAASFVGILSPYTLPVGEEDNCLILLSGNQLAWGQGGTTMKGMRAYFRLNESVPAGASARISFGANSTTDIVTATEAAHAAPKKVLRNGQIYIVREGRTYNIHGTQIQ